jgi:hypothetical protein
MTAPLRWPEDFQPREGIRRILVGVRLLGPGSSFFRALRESQAARDRSALEAWGTDAQRLKLSRVFGAFLHRRVGWPSRLLLQEDSFEMLLLGGLLDWV